ncbi:DUF3291 domain-containing protein [Tenacibaculum sp. M341]|uniref:DUF3291 domain-containing protein n=1 Tax=Tenacibaculum sp. M341 TaxID=2530339 RepID=UPI00104BBD3C|nr:DUF3291 domain-containing protein [Tenacibaculum sp. M341]TCI93795.1 DUF3291 domain-containing protein [Tenacibaculum sp. M341]
MNKKHLAQYNIIKLKDELNSPIIKEFKDFLAPVNLLAEESSGFIWRLKDESGESATELETPYEDKLIFVNMSVWENYASLSEYTYKTVHSYFLKSRKKWANEIEGHKAVMWYIDKGHIPTISEAKKKLDLLNQNGSSPTAFSMSELYNESGEKYKK